MIQLNDKSLTFLQWKAWVTSLHPTAKFLKETGSGETYVHVGDWVGHTGPDMQADCVGVWSTSGFCSVWDPHDIENGWFERGAILGTGE